MKVLSIFIDADGRVTDGRVEIPISLHTFQNTRFKYNVVRMLIDTILLMKLIRSVQVSSVLRALSQIPPPSPHIQESFIRILVNFQNLQDANEATYLRMSCECFTFGYEYERPLYN